MKTLLRMTAQQHEAIMAHVLPHDGNEAVAIALCGRRAGTAHHLLTVHRIIPIPYEECSLRQPNRVTWPTERLIPLLGEASKRGMAILKIHGHPQHYPYHSEIDDVADRELFTSIYGWMDDEHPHASAIFMPDGQVVARIIHPDGQFEAIQSIQVVGDDLRFFDLEQGTAKIPAHSKRTAQAFGEDTFKQLNRRKIAVIGCSGTGSWVIEQLGRYAVKELVLVDPDYIDELNLNRIPATAADAEAKILKVDLMKRRIEEMGLGTKVQTFSTNLFSPVAVKAVAECDAIFGCVDSIDGRWLINRLAAFYLIPYFDLGVKLEADGCGGIDHACAGVQYLQPGQSLWSRGMFSLEQVRAAGTKRRDPQEYERLRKDKYVVGLPADERPAVISFNMAIAGWAVAEFLARLHPYREDSNTEYASVMLSFSQMRICTDLYPDNCPTLSKSVGRGDVEPLLEIPELSEKEAIASC